MKNNKFFIVLFLIFNQTITHAEDIHQFAKNVIKVVEKSPGGDPIGESEGKFRLTKEQADQVVAYSKVNHELSEHDKIKVKPGPTCPLTNPSTSVVPDATQPTAIAPHVGVLQITTTTTTPTPAPITGGSGFAPSAAAVSLVVIPVTPDQVYTQLIANPQDWQNILAANKDKLSADQKVALISKLGGSFSNGYNYARAADKNATGFIDTAGLLTAVATGKPGGICRDIALAQTQMLEGLGFKNNYIVAYKTYEGHHATVITSNPADGNIVKFNYDEVSGANKGSGTGALGQDTTLPDFGLEYKIYDTKGKPVVSLPSEIGQILKDTAG